MRILPRLTPAVRRKLLVSCGNTDCLRHVLSADSRVWNCKRSLGRFSNDHVLLIEVACAGGLFARLLLLLLCAYPTPASCCPKRSCIVCLHVPCLVFHVAAVRRCNAYFSAARSGFPVERACLTRINSPGFSRASRLI